ncbi:MAG: Rad52/Rad22 family DNA repair protein [Pyrinomonadaceae bacterium]
MAVNSNIRLEKRAKAIAAKGLVVRKGDHFIVSSATIHGDKEAFEVRRNESGAIVCECADFGQVSDAGSWIRCEHILAVRFALVKKNTEAPVKDAEGIDERSATEADAEKTNNTESRVSERGEQTNDDAPANEVASRQAASKTAVRDRFRDMQGDREMKQIDLKKADVGVIEQDDPAGDRSNVLEFSATLRELKKHVDPNLVKQREGWRDRNGNVQMIDYVEWHTVADILDEAAPNWAHTVKDIRQIGDLMTVTVAITIDGVTREGIGTGVAQSEMGIKKAEHDALKRAAVKFGIARELYKKESEAIEIGAASPSGDEGDGFPTNPVARSLGELVTAKQLGMIRAIAREINVDPDEACNSVMNCSTDELTKRAASSLIQHLQDKQRNNDSSINPPLRRAS